ncbi:MAG: hypothetical protein ACNYPH_04945 [Gammaproteobacteria bacterium WSBS_2016_MAG_OTU1]
MLSLYCHFNVATGVIGEPQTKLERVFIDDNYSLEDFAAATTPKVKMNIKYYPILPPHFVKHRPKNK